MFDRIFSAALAFAVLTAGTLAVGAAMFEEPARIVQLPRVEITGKRIAVQAIAQGEDTAVQTAVR